MSAVFLLVLLVIGLVLMIFLPGYIAGRLGGMKAVYIIDIVYTIIIGMIAAVFNRMVYFDVAPHNIHLIDYLPTFFVSIFSFIATFLSGLVGNHFKKSKKY